MIMFAVVYRITVIVTVTDVVFAGYDYSAWYGAQPGMIVNFVVQASFS